MACASKGHYGSLEGSQVLGILYGCSDLSADCVRLKTGAWDTNSVSGEGLSKGLQGGVNIALQASLVDRCAK